MLEILLNIPNQSINYMAALIVLVLLLGESVLRLQQLRWGIAGIVYLTIGMWYFIDPPYRPEAYRQHGDELDFVYIQVIIFLVSFRFFIATIPAKTPSRALRAFDPRELDRGPIIRAIVLLWLVLFSIGMYRANFKVLECLFPIGARFTGAQMWARGRFGGSTDFLVSVGNYCYMMCCAAFGIIGVATRKSNVRTGMFLLAVLTWPMFLLSGTRSSFLSVCMPAILAMLILKRWNRSQQIVFLAVCLGLMNTGMLIVIAHRNQGLQAFFEESSSLVTTPQNKHEGLNMPEELVYINRYQATGQLEPYWGGEYFAQAVNFIPRAIWPGKPFPGGEFAALRVGYNSSGQVNATISSGLVGQGVQNFGKWFGPIAAALLVSLIAKLMCRLPQSGVLFLRSSVVLFMLALIPNLGRDLTLFTLWPVIFAIVGVRYLETTGRFQSAVSRTRLRRGQHRVTKV